MRACAVLILAAASMDLLAADPNETRIEQLMAAPAKAPAAAAAKPDPKAAKAKANEPDSAAGLVGQRVAVQTRSNGLYLGTLTSVTRDALVLAIELPSRTFSHTVPRSNVAGVTAR